MPAAAKERSRAAQSGVIKVGDPLGLAPQGHTEIHLVEQCIDLAKTRPDGRQRLLLDRRIERYAR